MKQIPLSRNQFALIDDEDYERVSQHKWSLDKNGYVVRKLTTGKRQYQKVMLHRFILEAPDGYDVDFLDENPLNCCRQNLRLLTRTQNNATRHPYQGTSSQYKGVSKRTDKRRKIWRAMIGVNNQRINLGAFEDEIDAAKAYDEAARKYFGEYARLNFPDDEPE